MRRLVATACALALVATLASTTAVAGAGTTISASGTWAWVNTNMKTETLGGTLVYSGDEEGTWSGTLKGSSYDIFQMTAVPSTGLSWGVLTVTLTGSVAGKAGTLTMWLTLRKPAGGAMGGTWTVLSGAKALAGATGSGTWVSAGTGSNATYKGKITLK